MKALHKQTGFTYQSVLGYGLGVEADASQGHHVKKKRQTLFMCCNFQACIQREGVPSRAFSSLFKITLSVHPLIGGTEIRCQGMPPCCLQQQAICNNAFPPKVISLSLSLPSFLLLSLNSLPISPIQRWREREREFRDVKVFVHIWGTTRKTKIQGRQ